MNHLSRDETIALLGKLSSDDVFRALFQKNPKAGLKQLGVSDELIAGLPASSLAPRPLAGKKHFASARKDVINSRRSECMALIIPFHKVTFGDDYIADAA